MLTVTDYDRIRRAYHLEKKSMRQISRELGHGYWTIRKALDASEPPGYQLQAPRPAPVLGPYKGMLDRLLEEEKGLPRKQRYTGKKLFELIQAAGYRGAESTVRRYVGAQRKRLRRPQVYVPLTFEPGEDAQVDWGTGWVELAGELTEVQLFVMRMNYSRKLFVMAFPTQRQEAFFEAHVQAFAFFGGVPKRITYDNLTTAVKRIVKEGGREEQQRFIALRSHYLFASRFCTPGQGNEKGRVEDGVGYVQRQFLVPMLKVTTFAELNAHLRAACQADDARRIDRQPHTIAEAWAEEARLLRPLPAHPFDSALVREATLNGYSQVTFETNRYSVPTDKARKHLTLKAYPFYIEILAGGEVIARHERSYARKQDILDPLHYLPLLAQRPGAFDHAQPLHAWRQAWPEAYEQLLEKLKAQHGAARGVKAFIQVLQLHQHHAALLVAQAVTQALAEGVPHYEGVRYCLNRLLEPPSPPQQMAQPPEGAVDIPIPAPTRYDALLPGGNV
jgi:transposase